MPTITHTISIEYEIATDTACPICGEEADGTVEVFEWSLAYGEVSIRNGEVTVKHLGETDSDYVWNSQKTLEVDGTPLLACIGGHVFLVKAPL